MNVLYIFHQKVAPKELFNMSLRQAQRPCFYRLDKPFEFSTIRSLLQSLLEIVFLSEPLIHLINLINLIFVFYHKGASTELIGNRVFVFYKQFTPMELFSMSLRQAQRPCFYRLKMPYDPSTTLRDRRNGY